MRARSLQNLDDFLKWTLPQEMTSYALAEPLEMAPIEMSFSQAKEFIEWHGFLSLHEPLVGKVLKKKGELYVASCLLVQIAYGNADLDVLHFATDEALAKVVAYRDLKIGDDLMLLSNGRLVLYHVDHVFNLWRGMPAFGLVGDRGSVPILLFRGTDFSLDSERGWASLMSDIDLSGPGFKAFTKGRQDVRSWLQKVSEVGPKARLIGFSLGGSLAAYTYLYEQEWVNAEGSVAFNPPGLSEEVFQEWNQLPEERRNAFQIYVTRGDLVSKIGKLFGNVYELSLEAPLKPLKAHTAFLAAEKKFFQSKVDVEKENLARRP